jgi:molecular chaperone HtpG
MLLDRCSVFASGFDLQSACAVAGFDDVDDYAILDLLDALVRKSLVVADRSGGQTRFSMLETIRQFAEEQLVASGEATEVRAAHARHFAGRENEIMALWDSPRQREAYTWFTTELANLRTAFRWAADHADLATIATYAAFLGLWLENYEPTTRWVSSGEGTYTIESVEDAPQGTSVTLHLKPEDAEDQLHDYTAEWKIRELVKKYSDFIAWPIRMQVERRTPAPEGGAVEGGEETVTVETQTLNSMKALWAKSKDEVSEDEYNEFYKHIAHAWDDPLEVIAMKGEGTFEYQALLFLPSHAPFDLFTRDAKIGVQLYVKRVFVMGDCDQLMPRYLRFVKGVVDAQDMSLNVSREILQQDRQINTIRRRLTKKVLSTIKDLQSQRPQDYHTLWSQFGGVLKEGLMSDFDNQDLLLRISSFASTHSDEEPTTLAEYVERMKDGQENIFYATGGSREQLLKSPHLEAFKAKGYEVLLLTDPVDEIWVGSVPEFDGKPLQSVAKGEVDLDSEDEKAAHEAERQDQERDFADLLTWLTETLSDHVKEARLSTRLTESPACLITDAFGITPALARMYRASGQAVPIGKRILELNPKHPLVTGLQQAHQNRGDDSSLVETAELLYGTALLAEGDLPEDPAKFAGLLADRLARTG